MTSFDILRFYAAGELTGIKQSWLIPVEDFVEKIMLHFFVKVCNFFKNFHSIVTSFFSQEFRWEVKEWNALIA